MSVYLYDDDFETIGVEIPPYASITREYDINRKFTIGLNATNENKVEEILKYINLRNQTLSFNNQTNINGRLVGDYTCAMSINGLELYAKITVSTSSDSSTRFHDNGVWQKDGATVSLSIEEVIKV